MKFHGPLLQVPTATRADQSQELLQQLARADQFRITCLQLLEHTLFSIV